MAAKFPFDCQPDACGTQTRGKLCMDLRFAVLRRRRYEPLRMSLPTTFMPM